MTKRESSSPATRLSINTAEELYELPFRPHLYILLVTALLGVDSRIERESMVDGKAVSSNGHYKLQIFSKFIYKT